jgi:protein-tyrosine-phosphatase/predicted ATP-grasp superfamily ATP-dependent carboligase
MLKALVLDAFSSAGLETIQSLGRHGVIVHASSPSACLAFSSRYVAQRWEQPTGASAGPFLEWLRQINAQHNYSLIVPSTEYSLLLLGDLQEDDPLRARIQLASRESILATSDKWSTLELARSCGVPAPPSRLHDSQSDSSAPGSFPVVLKATRSMIPVEDGLQQMQSFLAKSRSDWERVLLSLLPLTPVIEQAFLTGHGVGIELLYRNGVMIWHFCHQRLHEGSGGGGLGSGSSYRRSVLTPPKLLADATALLNRLRWHGVAMVEFLVTPAGRYYLMEINPRLWGSLALAIDAGVDFPWGLFLMATGQTVPPQPDYRVPYYTRALAQDTRWTLQCLRSRPLKGLWNVMGFARVFTGRESWDHFAWSDLGVTAIGVRDLLRDAIKSVTNRPRKRVDFQRAKRLHLKNLIRLRLRLQFGRKVLFLCHGNICRSPVAEQMARREMPGYNFSSAGFHPESGRPSPIYLQQAARALGFDLSALRSNTVSPQMVEEADLIILMDVRNLSDFRQQFPAAIQKVLLLGMFLSPPSEIRDPIDANLQQTIRVLQQIERGIEEFAKEFGAVDHLKLRSRS